jgi:hypothetical protein
VSSTANNPFFSDATTEAAVSAVAVLLNNGFITIYNGSQPTDANTAIGAQTPLATMGFGSTAFPTIAASGTAPSKIVTATAGSITSDTNASATGTATWFRCFKSDGVTGVMDGSVGTSGSDLNLNTTSIIMGATVAVTAFSITQAE